MWGRLVPDSEVKAPPIGLGEFQKKIEAIYGAKDQARGVEGTYFWFAEEVGELTRALRRNDLGNLEEEFADTLAWLVTLASMKGVDMEVAVERKYGQGCAECKRTPCVCQE